MTIGIGGWGSRRKPMALVRAILRSGADGPDRRLLRRPRRRAADRGAGTSARSCAASCRSTRSRSSRTSGGPARRARSSSPSSTRACCSGGCSRPRSGCRSCRSAPAWAPTCCGSTRELRTVRSPYDDGEELVAMPALPLDVALVHLNRADAARQRPVPRTRPVLRRPVLPGGRARLRVLRADRADRRPARGRAAADPADQPGHGPRRGRDARRRALHQLRAGLRPGRGVPGRVRGGGRRPAEWQRFRAEYLAGDEASYQQAVRQFAARTASARAVTAPMTRPDDGRGLRGGVRRGLARRRRDPGQPDGPDPDARRPAGPGSPSRPDLLLTDGEATLLAPAARRRPWSRAGCRTGTVFTMRGGRAPARDDGRQPRSTGSATRTSPASATGPGPRPSCSACAARPATRSTTRSATGCPRTPPGCSSSGSTWSAASATTGRPASARRPPGSTSSAWS